MTIPIVKGELLAELEQHELWVQSLGGRGKQAEWVGYDLTAYPLKGRQLTEIVMANCDLSHMDLAKTDLYGAFLNNSSFRGADLSGAILANSYLAEVDFANASLKGAIIRKPEASWGISFKGADLEDADFTNAYLDNIRFDAARLYECCFEGATLIEVYFVGSKLHGLIIPDDFYPVSAYIGDTQESLVRLEGESLRSWLVAEAARQPEE